MYSLFCMKAILSGQIDDNTIPMLDIEIKKMILSDNKLTISGGRCKINEHFHIGIPLVDGAEFRHI